MGSVGVGAALVVVHGDIGDHNVSVEQADAQENKAVAARGHEEEKDRRETLK